MTGLSEKIYDVITTAAANVVSSYRPAFLNLIESPIEELMAYAIWTNLGWAERAEIQNHSMCFATVELEATKQLYRLPRVAAQVSIGPYCVDFLFYDCGTFGRPPIYVAVECDGHDFHDRTKEQAAHDRKRDRELLAMGVKVMRFTGAQIWADAGACALSVIEYIEHQSHKDYQQEMKRIENEHGSFDSYIKFLKVRKQEREAAALNGGAWPEEVAA